VGPPIGAALTGNAVCAVDSGETTVTWSVYNNTVSPITIGDDSRGLTFSPNPVPADTIATASEVFDGPPAVEQLTDTVTVTVGTAAPVDLSATVTLGPCTGPPAPDDVQFSFTNEASSASASVGDTVEYRYCAENTSDVDVEVVQVVDDRFGVLDLPDGQTLVAPGETLCTSDIAPPMSYTTTDADAGTTIVNNAVATVRTLEGEPRSFQASDAAEVNVSAAPIPPTGASGMARQLYLAVMAVGVGSALFLAARSRRNTGG
jgi:hypothetical protein